MNKIKNEVYTMIFLLFTEIKKHEYTAFCSKYVGIGIKGEYSKEARNILARKLSNIGLKLDLCNDGYRPKVDLEIKRVEHETATEKGYRAGTTSFYFYMG